MPNIIFRNDDVNPNSNLAETFKIYSIIKAKFPEAQIYSCISIFGKTNPFGSPYASMKNIYNSKYYYDVDLIFNRQYLFNLETIVSHGLFHFAHRQMSYETQKFSILTSCNLLNTKLFLPPFIAWNDDTEAICNSFNIKLIGNEPWKSLEKNRFDSTHYYWLFHGWQWTPRKFERALNE